MLTVNGRDNPWYSAKLCKFTRQKKTADSAAVYSEPDYLVRLMDAVNKLLLSAIFVDEQLS